MKLKYFIILFTVLIVGVIFTRLSFQENQLKEEYVFQEQSQSSNEKESVSHVKINGVVDSILMPFDCQSGEDTPTIITLRDNIDIIIDRCNLSDMKGGSPSAGNVKRGDMIEAEVKMINANTYSIIGSNTYFVKIVGIEN
jgi:hypothetical protein